MGAAADVRKRAKLVIRSGLSIMEFAFRAYRPEGVTP